MVFLVALAEANLHLGRFALACQAEAKMAQEERRAWEWNSAREHYERLLRAETNDQDRLSWEEVTSGTRLKRLDKAMSYLGEVVRQYLELK